MKRLTLILAALFTMITISTAQKKISTEIYPPSYRYWTIAPMAGITFPAQTLSSNFNTGYNLGVDAEYRMNQSFGLFTDLNYNHLTGINNLASSNYLELSAGPRLFVGGKANSSALWVEGGVGAYNFNTSGLFSGPTNAGFKLGVGGSLPLSNKISLMGKGDYNHVFTANHSSSFTTYSAGLRFILK